MKRTDTRKPESGHAPRSSQPFFGAQAATAFFAPGQSVQREPFFQRGISASFPLQAKLTVGAVGDRYEQEADRVAAQVVNQINNPAVQQRGDRSSVQRMGKEDDELQRKPLLQRETDPVEEDELQRSPLAGQIQRVELPEDDELQMKPLLQRETDPEEEDELQMKPDSLQRETDPEEEDELQMKPAIAPQVTTQGGDVSAGLESAIQQARGGGQPIAENVRVPLEQAFGADFSGVQVHTDARSDQLNQSIQAKAFTTGQDVFFRQGAYEPGSRGGQELIAHELTHVVQQNGGAVRRALLPPQPPSAKTPSALTGDPIIQRTAINPALFFPGARADNDVAADIAGNAMSGFGTMVNGGLWHTRLNFGPLVQPGLNTMHPEGSGVTGVIGPDHPYGSKPYTANAIANNALAAGLPAGSTGHGNVAAHIVNDQLGGPGIDQNLFAFPGVANTLMQTQVESKMKAAVEAGNYIYYQAAVHHPINAPADYITMSWNKLSNTGADIGGGQTNVRINANNTAANQAVVGQVVGVEAQSTKLLHPSNATVIQGNPFGLFQMPDPKATWGPATFLDFTEFPAVGNKRAFEDFLTANRNSNSAYLQLKFNELPETSIYFNVGSWIENGKTSHITIKARRGITQSMVNDLKKGSLPNKIGAMIEILATGDAPKVIPAFALQLAKEARKTARARLS